MSPLDRISPRDPTSSALRSGRASHRRWSRRASRGSASTRSACARAASCRARRAVRPSARGVGSKTSARASATRCCWPPESWAGLRSLNCASRTISSARVTRVPISALGIFRTESGNATFSATRHVRKQRVVLEHHADVALVRRQAGRPICPRAVISPWLGRSKPASMFKVVVLPEPDGPRNVRNSPRPMVRFSRLTAWKSPYIFSTSMNSTRFRRGLCRSWTICRLGSPWSDRSYLPGRRGDRCAKARRR